MRITRLTLYTLLLAFSLPLFAAQDEPVLLPPDVAFKVAAHATTPEQLAVSWQIAPGYYLYQAKFHLTAQPAQVQLGKFDFPRHFES